MTQPQPILFIVGNSRSGTTMLGRMFGNHSHVHTFQEIHFFEQMVDADTVRQRPAQSDDRLLAMLERLLTSARDGLFAAVTPGAYVQDAKAILDLAPGRDPVTVYVTFLAFETARMGGAVSCEQTPRYLYQAAEILDALPQARMICMIRDPRSVLLSQKNKWRRRGFGASNMPRLWAVRAWVNYHPYTVSRMWASASRRARLFQDHPRFRVVKYETLLRQPEQTLRDLAEFIGLPYEPAMLDIAQVGSSTGQDRPDRLGVDVGRIEAWKQGGLTDTEIGLCERTTRDELARWGYAASDRSGSVLRQTAVMAGFLLKSAAALALNIRRFKNLRETIKRRFA